MKRMKRKDHGETDSDDVLLGCDGESSPEFKKEMGRKSALLILFLPDDVPDQVLYAQEAI